ncbi:hypothetical protein QRO11_03585 [Paracidovorax citrulli]|uniref:hypothetical protein n=1 Tax=Paracidovorax citrulli TaxID=80869 RepID=UPI00088B6FEF|nr:hypothetical protein [Paracidovorax citrulli]UMT89784.1 hypothetical protein FRC90_18060 [Paracidovorax citrulli]WIY35434.1 hypothetical protein QRO11_03585 [Paracidovorax citrulli]SDJ07170.1 hypothetical protein SAMN04489709_101153 [Paracidovorax citrulli]
MSRTPPKPVPMACLTIGYNHYLLPAAKAIKAAEILQDAFDCEHHYDDGDFVYEVASTQPRVSFALVRANQLRMPPGGLMPDPSKPLRLPRS